MFIADEHLGVCTADSGAQVQSCCAGPIRASKRRCSEVGPPCINDEYHPVNQHELDPGVSEQGHGTTHANEDSLGVVRAATWPYEQRDTSGSLKNNKDRLIRFTADDVDL
eukprot:1419820-Pyramimonas_sp.AAC.1